MQDTPESWLPFTKLPKQAWNNLWTNYNKLRQDVDKFSAVIIFLSILCSTPASGPGATKTDEFSEKLQRAFAPPPSFSDFCSLQFHAQKALFQGPKIHPFRRRHPSLNNDKYVSWHLQQPMSHLLGPYNMAEWESHVQGQAMIRLGSDNDQVISFHRAKRDGILAWKNVGISNTPRLKPFKMRKVVLQKLCKPKYQRLHGKAWDRISIVCCRQRSPLLWPMLKQSTDFRAKLNPGESSANWSRCWKQGVILIVYYNVGRSNIHESGLEFGCKYKSVLISRLIKLCQLKTQRGNWKFVGKKVGIKDAPFWNVLFPNGHCPNSFWPPPPAKQAP